MIATSRLRRLSAVLLVLASSALPACGWRQTGAGTGPIIFISIDTLRADHLPIYGYRDLRTPAIDGLAAAGVVFDRAYAHAPQTLPSHVSILTGRLPFESAVRDNVGFVLRPDVPTLPRWLHERGYLTGGVVSSLVLRRETGLGHWFDFYDSTMPEQASGGAMWRVARNGDESLKVAERWMDSVKTERFFLFFHLYEPHAPYTPPAQYANYAPYDGEIAYTDAIVGRLLDWLKTHQLYDGATIVLFSDHGEGLGDHGEQEHGLFLYDETIRVPLIVKLAGQARAGQRVAAPVQHIDLVPTILDLVGAPPDASLHGRSLRPLLEGKAPKSEPGAVYSEALYGRFHYGWGDLYSLTDSRYRFIKAPRPELYDLERDPRERVNVVGERAQTAAAMRSALDKTLAGVTLGATTGMSQGDLEGLRELGYIGIQPTPAQTPGESLPDPKDKVAILEMHQRAMELAAARRFDDSIALLKKILAQEPAMKDVWRQLGEQQFGIGFVNDALDTFRQLVRVDPRDGRALVDVATVLLDLGRPDEAASHARMGLKLLSSSADASERIPAYELLVKLAMARNDAAEARKLAKAAQQANPDFPLPSYVDAMLLYRQGRHHDALPLFQETIRQLEGRAIRIPELHFYTGDTLAVLGIYKSAIEEFRTEIRSSPQNIKAYTALALVLWSQGQQAEASSVVGDMLTASPGCRGAALADRLWAKFGDVKRSGAVRAAGLKACGPVKYGAAESYAKIVVK